MSRHLASPGASRLLSPAPRLTSLDGLRGAAALIVLAHHTLLTKPGLADPYYTNVPATGTTAWLVHTPLHLLWAGTEAVYLFFVLSGFVLGLAVSSPKFTWRTYLPARLVRLYIPVTAAVLLGATIITVFPRGGEASVWLRRRVPEYVTSYLEKDLTLLAGPSGAITPLWSLQWEVLFSLLLAAFIATGLALKPSAQIVAALIVSTYGFYSDVLALAYMPMFLIGTALAQAWPAVWHQLKRTRESHARWLAVVVIGTLLTTSFWLLMPFGPVARIYLLTRPAIIIGVTALLLAAAVWLPLARLLSSPVFRWAGIVSFSLYLVHEPIVIAFASAWPGSNAALAAAVLVSLCTGTGFFLLVERPSHRLARALGRDKPVANAADALSSPLTVR
ncbi:acyltransferase [Frigoribacterium sp. PvP032]|uniref:acyltransferase family protein n=1 Tax=Frigoribacterium sp. PvP032 TaxID=2806589 RepID=UPI001AE17E77|nr:acyltransferase [Frigoribacterium sp. PvP032]MBP1190622.1 peptidoglycan/LPS O-acetylase OafA/YrhL [Frigoribacterium sp. PvP032]